MGVVNESATMTFSVYKVLNIIFALNFVRAELDVVLGMVGIDLAFELFCRPLFCSRLLGIWN